MIAALLLTGACSTSAEISAPNAQPNTLAEAADEPVSASATGEPATAPTTVPTALAPTPTPVVDTDGCPLDAPSYVGVELVGEQFRTDLRCADFTGADVAATQLIGLRLDQVTFAGATLTDVTFDGVDASNVDFSGATLLAVEFEEVNLTGADFTGAQLVDVEFDDATCPDGTNSGQNGETCLNNLGASG